MTPDLLIHPALPLLAAALMLPLLRGPLRAALVLAAPLAALAAVWMTPGGSALAQVFGTVFALASFLGGLYALNQKSTLELSAALASAGGALGVVFAGDLLGLFVFWEVLAISSVLLIWANGTAAYGAGLRYAVLHFLGGVLLLAGIAGEAAATGSIAFQHMTLERLPQWLILAGVLINAAAVPLSAWLPDAYPQSSWSGMVFLSAFTTKTAVFVLIKGFAGADVLIWVGLAMVIYGSVYAVLENDMRRMLAYSIVDQVGFMVTAIGIGTDLALNGAAAHAFAHILYKATLVMAAGSVLLMTGATAGPALGGLWRRMPVTAASAAAGALAIAAFPFTSGFATKTMIAEAASQQHLTIAWLVLQAASAAVALHAGFRFPWTVFFGRDGGSAGADPPWNMQAAMIAGAVLCIGIGLAPGPLYALMPFPPVYSPYSAGHVAEKLLLLGLGLLAFLLLRSWLSRQSGLTIDVDLLWRGRAAGRWARGLEQLMAAADTVSQFASNGGAGLVRLLKRHHGPDGLLGRSWPTGAMAFWTTAVLAAFVIVGAWFGLR